MTAMMLLTANGIHKRKHDMLSMDLRLVEDSLRIMRQQARNTEFPGLQSFLSNCSKLHNSLQQSVKRGSLT